MTQKERKEYNRIKSERLLHITQLRNNVSNHPDYNDCVIAVDMLMRSDYYESGTILGISPTRKGFDDIYNYSDLYRGGLYEIKVGDNYVIYGFDFD